MLVRRKASTRVTPVAQFVKLRYKSAAYRYVTVTLPLHYCCRSAAYLYVTVTLPLHCRYRSAAYRYVTVTLPLRYCCRSAAYRYVTVTLPLHCRYRSAPSSRARSSRGAAPTMPRRCRSPGLRETWWCRPSRCWPSGRLEESGVAPLGSMAACTGELLAVLLGQSLELYQ